MSWLGDLTGFEGFNAKGMLKQIKDNPLRLLYGSADPFSTKVWNGVLGTNDKPIVDQMGGATQDRFRDAQAAGINTGAGKGMHNLAHVIAGAAALGGGANALGGSGGAGSSLGELGSSSTGFGMGDLGLGSGSAGAGDFSLGTLAGTGDGTYSLAGAGGGLFGGGGGSAAAGGMNLGQLFQTGVKGFNQGGGQGNEAALRQQQQIADQLRRNRELQQLSQEAPGWVNMNGGQ